MSFIKRVLGDPNERELKKIRPLVNKINDLEDEIVALSDEDLQARTAEFRTQLDQCDNQDEQDDVLDAILPEAYAMVREAAKRSIGQRHFDVQMIGGVVLHQGKIAEMGTGEGKTLVGTLPSYLNALTGRGVHIVTTNDYLAHIQSEWMGRIHRLLGLTVGCILSDGSQDFEAKKANYAADITYGTNNEFGFDYLRDNMVGDLAMCVQRQLNFSIVDEVDNILIDEARTPLIISAPSIESPEMYNKFARVIPILKEEEDYTVELKTRHVAINDSGIDKIEAALGMENLYGDMDLTRFLENALKAEVVFLKDRDYIVRDGEVLIVDEHTGRILAGRRYSEGLHQAIEAKERVKVQAENRTVATITFQNYFRIYRKLAGMTGTALTEAQEFDKIYNLDVVSIPPHRPLIRKDEMDFVYKNESAKYRAVVEEIKDRNEMGQPVLVGTTSVENSERVAALLTREGLPHEVLNAKNHSREAAIIAQAGRSGAVTISTNMAGRGTDILLGGNPAGFVDQILSEWDIDIDVATEEDRAEALAEAERRCEEDRARVVELGGLYVIGTERHDSRRIDNQLRGRSGRQGDPGESRFFISLGDDLMRRFGSDRVAGIMDRLGMEEDVPIENGMISRMIEQAQQKVESYYFDMRKNIVEYDDVISKHRETIYTDRQAILAGVGLHERVLTLVSEEVQTVAGQASTDNLPEHWNLDAVVTLFDRWHMPLPDDFFPANLALLKRPAFIAQCVDWARDSLEDHLEELRSKVRELGEDVDRLDQFFAQIERNILLQVVDRLWMEHIDTLDELRSSIGLRGVAQVDPLVEFKREGFAHFDDLKKNIRHFVAENIMANMMAIQVQIGIPAPAAAPPAPLPPQHMQTNTEVIAQATGQSKGEGGLLANGNGTNGNGAARKALPSPKKALTQNKAIIHAQRKSAQAANVTPSHSRLNVASAVPASKTPSKPLASRAVDVAAMPKVGPNDPCPCGSKQKYKFCHGLRK